MKIRTIQVLIPSFLIIFFVLFSMIPTFYEMSLAWKIKPNRHFELVHNFPTDYQLYLSKIRQGKEGAWLSQEKYTTEPHAGSLSQILYVLIGRLTHFVHIQTPYVWFSYHAARMVFAVLLLFVAWRVSKSIFNTFSKSILTFLLIVTASTWPKFETVNGWPRFGGYMPWYTVIDSLQRTTFLPHVLLSQAILIFIIWVFTGGFVSKKTPGNYVFLGLIGIVLGIVFPPGLFFLFGLLGFWSAFDILGIVVKAIKNSSIDTKFVKKTLINWVKETFFGRIVFILLSAPTMVYYSLLLSEYPWKRLVEFDVLHPTKFSYLEYALALGATLPFGIVGVIFWLIRKINLERRNLEGRLEAKLTGFVVWIFTWGFFMILFNFIPQQSPTRFTQMTPHIPLGIMTMYGIYVLCQWLQQIFKSNNGVLNNKFKDVNILQVLLTIPVVIILLGLGTMFSSWMWQKDFVDHKLRADIPLVPRGAEVMYPLLDIVNALSWLQDNSPRNSAVLTGPATGNLVPVYAGNYTYVGHANTVNGEIKDIVSANFYGRKRPKEEFIDVLRANNIQHVLYGPEEMELAGGATDLRVYYPFLTEVYRNGMVVVYKVNI